MLCGYSKSLMNPPIGIAIAGSYDLMESKGRIDDCYARAVAFRSGDATCVIISADLCHMRTEDSDWCREKISDITGIDPSAVIVVCTHTHASGHTWIGSVKEPDEEGKRKILAFKQTVRDAVVKSAVDAVADLMPSKIYYAKDEAEGISNVRRFRMKDGGVMTNPGRHNPEIDHPIGEPDNRVKLIRIEREGGKDIYIVNFGMHATTVGGRTYLSSDYPGVVCRTLEAALDVDCVFWQGAAGDVVQINANPTPEIERIIDADSTDKAKGKRMATYAGHKIAGTVLRMHCTAEQIPDGKLRITERTARLPANKAGGDIEEAKRINALQLQGRHSELPYKGMALVTVVANAARILRMRDEPDYYDYCVYVLSLGELVLVALPGEPFAELGRAVEAVLPTDKTVLLSIANHTSTYMPTTAAYSEGGYEVATTSVGPGSAEILVDAVRAAFDGLE